MGIRSLQTFMERNVKGGLYTVNIEQEIWKAKERVENSLIVIDLMSLNSLFCADKRTQLCGGQPGVVEQMADIFFNRLTDAGAALVFFRHGRLRQNKHDEWMRGQNDKYDRMIRILDAIESGMPLTEAAGIFETNFPAFETKLKILAKRHGKMLVSNRVETDQALATYATKHNALAVITNDTDFLIFESRWQLWHSSHMDINTLVTKAFGKLALLRTLGLKWSQMAIWATLAGNDFFHYDALKPFLNELGPHSQKFYRLADYVRRLPLRNNKLDDDTVQTVLGRVYRNRRVPTEAYEWFRQSVAFYQVDESSVVKHVDDPFAYLQEPEYHFTHAMLTGTPFYFKLHFFDYRSNEFGNFYEIIKPIIARIGGILLFYHKNERQKINVATKRSHEEPYSFGTVSATFPTDITPPPVMDLISKDEKVQASLLQRKLQLWRWVCSEDLTNEQDMNNVPPSFMCTVLTLYRLREYGAIQRSEADLLLLIAQQLSAGTFDPIHEPYPERLNTRAFQLGFLYQKIYSHMHRACKALGLPQEYQPSVPYDGHRFHNMYSEWTGAEIQSNQIEPIAEWRMYKNVQSPRDFSGTAK